MRTQSSREQKKRAGHQLRCPARPERTRRELYLRLIVKFAVLITAPADAVILTTSFFVTAVVVTVKVADWLPLATVTVAGTDAFGGLALDRLTWKPPAGAGAVSVTVPIELLPPRTLEGLRES